MSKFMFDMDRPICCGDCKLFYMNRECEGAYEERICPILNEEVKLTIIDKDCPLKKVSPRKLIWKEMEGVGSIADVGFAKYKVAFGMAYLVVNDECKGAVECALNYVKTNDHYRLRRICQEHADKIFNEIMGVQDAEEWKNSRFV